MDKFIFILPGLIMIECFVACIPMFWCKQWAQGVYWLAAGIINLSVIMMGRS